MSPPPLSKKHQGKTEFEYHKVICQGDSRLLALSSFLPREWIHVKVRQVDLKNGSIFLEVMHV